MVRLVEGSDPTLHEILASEARMRRGIAVLAGVLAVLAGTWVGYLDAAHTDVGFLFHLQRTIPVIAVTVTIGMALVGLAHPLVGAMAAFGIGAYLFTPYRCEVQANGRGLNPKFFDCETLLGLRFGVFPQREDLTVETYLPALLVGVVAAAAAYLLGRSTSPKQRWKTFPRLSARPSSSASAARHIRQESWMRRAAMALSVVVAIVGGIWLGFMDAPGTGVGFADHLQRAIPMSVVTFALAMALAGMVHPAVGAIAAFGIGVYLFAPYWCGVETGGPQGLQPRFFECQTLLGMRFESFPRYDALTLAAYVPALLVGLLAAVGAYLIARRGKKKAQSGLMGATLLATLVLGVFVYQTRECSEWQERYRTSAREFRTSPVPLFGTWERPLLLARPGGCEVPEVNECAIVGLKVDVARYAG